MIPKIVHFHWEEGNPFNWMRMMSLYTFAKLNPRWEIRLIRTPEHIRNKKLNHICNEADWAWLEALYDDGGFALATDTVFVRPIPDWWCEDDMLICSKDRRNFYHNSFGSIGGTGFLNDCINKCEGFAHGGLAYQDMGVTLLNDMDKSLNGLKIRRMSETAITPIQWYEPQKCWEKEDVPIFEDTIGVTWFGGHESSREHEPKAGPGKDYAIVRLAEEVVSGCLV